MPDANPKHFLVDTVDGSLVLTITASQVHGDGLADSLRQEMQAVVAAHGARQVIIDFQNVSYISSAVFRPLLSLRRKLQEIGGRMVLCNLTPLVLDVFHVLRLISTSRSYPATFEVQPDVPSAVKALQTAAVES
jgi:anti-anti-sigma factor